MIQKLLCDRFEIRPKRRGSLYVLGQEFSLENKGLIIQNSIIFICKTDLIKVEPDCCELL